VSLPFAPPLLRWDGMHLVLALSLVEERLNAYLADHPQLEQVRLEGAHDALRLTATVVWKGRRARVGLDLSEIRLRHRRLGFRLRRVRLLGGVPVPRAAVEALLESLRSPLLRVLRGHGIVVLDLGRWLPPELTLRVLTVQCTSSYLHLWLGPGELCDVPAGTPPALPGPTAPSLPP
jgi:hypothetical protein